MIHPIVVYPDPILRKSINSKSGISNSPDDVANLRSTLQEIPFTWLTSKHLGLESNLVGIKVDEGLMILQNPEILDLKGRYSSRVEVDPSFPNFKTSVLRRNFALVRYTDEAGEKMEVWMDDVKSRLIQQALEQFAGKLMIDHVNGHRKRSIKGYLGRLEKGKFNAPYPTRSSILMSNE